MVVIRLFVIFCKYVSKLPVMSTIELKNLLIHRISEITDVRFLEALKTILDSKSESNVLPLTREQKDEIIASQKEISSGMFVDQNDIEGEVAAWLNAK
jgi:hypothetical protein